MTVFITGIAHHLCFVTIDREAGLSNDPVDQGRFARPLPSADQDVGSAHFHHLFPFFLCAAASHPQAVQQIEALPLRALGFHHLNETVVKEDNACIQGMLRKVAHLVKVEELVD